MDPGELARGGGGRALGSGVLDGNRSRRGGVLTVAAAERGSRTFDAGARGNEQLRPRLLDLPRRTLPLASGLLANVPARLGLDSCPLSLDDVRRGFRGR